MINMTIVTIILCIIFFSMLAAGLWGLYSTNIHPLIAKQWRIVENTDNPKQTFYHIEYKCLWVWIRLKYEEAADCWKTLDEAEQALRIERKQTKEIHHYR